MLACRRPVSQGAPATFPCPPPPPTHPPPISCPGQHLSLPLHPLQAGRTPIPRLSALCTCGTLPYTSHIAFFRVTPNRPSAHCRWVQPARPAPPRPAWQATASQAGMARGRRACRQAGEMMFPPSRSTDIYLLCLVHMCKYAQPATPGRQHMQQCSAGTGALEQQQPPTPNPPTPSAPWPLCCLPPAAPRAAGTAGRCSGGAKQSKQALKQLASAGQPAAASRPASGCQRNSQRGASQPEGSRNCPLAPTHLAIEGDDHSRLPLLPGNLVHCAVEIDCCTREERGGGAGCKGKHSGQAGGQPGRAGRQGQGISPRSPHSCRAHTRHYAVSKLFVDHCLEALAIVLHRLQGRPGGAGRCRGHPCMQDVSMPCLPGKQSGGLGRQSGRLCSAASLATSSLCGC